ncbi:MAG: hypothetical protein EBX92_01645 [Actinobacteria bacterium]|nr:hypothetical protein [Actinomycetota bacterium]
MLLKTAGSRFKCSCCLTIGLVYLTYMFLKRLSITSKHFSKPLSALINLKYF